MLIKNTNSHSREQFLSAFVSRVHDEAQLQRAYETAIPLFAITQEPGRLYGGLTEEGFRVFALRRFKNTFTQRIFFGTVEEDADGVVIRGAFRYRWRDKLLTAALFFLFALFLMQKLLPALLFALGGTAASFFLSWLVTLPREREVKTFLTELS